MFYTLTASFPLLVILRYYVFFIRVKTFFFFNSTNFMRTQNELIFIFLVLSFLVKLPIHPLHLWLPKAHVEAPVYGSIILAALILKIGSYGLIRFLFISNSNIFNFILSSLRLSGLIFIGFICLKELDLKVIIAYTSVAHIIITLIAFLARSH